MESLSRPFHRRKLSNANSFSGKNAYDGLFSGHRPKFDGVPAVNVEEYREIFSSGQAASSIPVLDLSTLQESSDGSNLKLGSTKPDYGKIFGGFRDEDIAVSYEELVARDKARDPLSTSQDVGGDVSFDALKQFNMSYNKISQRNKDGPDVTTHVTQLHAVPGFTCFIDESASQPKKETKIQKPSIPNYVHAPEKQPSQTPVESIKVNLRSHNTEEASKPKKEVKFQKPSIPNYIHAPEKQPSQTPVESKSRNHQDDKKVNLKSHNTEEASKPKMETEKKKSSEIDNVHPINSIKVDFHEKQPSQSVVESKSKYHQDDRKVNLNSHKTEEASKPKLETKRKKSSETDSVHDVLEKKTSQSDVESKSKYHHDDKKVNLKSHNTKDASKPKLETEKKKSSETESVHDILEKKTSKSAVESKSEYHHDDKKIDLNSHNPKASATNGKPASQSKKETVEKKSSKTDDVHDVLEKQTSQRVVEPKRSTYHQDESLSKDRISKKFEADINLPPANSATNVEDSHKDYKKRSTDGAFFSSSCFDEELDVNSAAGASAAALRKAIEKAQESIRIAKESVGRKKEGLKTFSNKSFKATLKVKARVENVTTFEEEEEVQKEKDNWIKEFFKAKIASVNTSQVSSRSTDGEKLFGAKKVINEINGKLLESEKNGSSHELKENKIVFDSKEGLEETKGVEYATTRSSEEVENNTNESLQKDNLRPNGFLVIEDTIKDEKPIELKESKDEVGPSDAYELAEETEEKNNLTLCQKVEDEKKVSHDSDESGYEKRFDESLGLLEDIKQDVVEQEDCEEVESEESHDPNSDDEASEKLFEDDRVLKEDSDTEIHMEEEETGEKFYDVCEVEIIENSSSDYDDAEESESIHGSKVDHIEVGTEEASCKVDQSDNNAESSQEVDNDVSISSPQVTVEDKEVIINTEEKEMFDETISADQTASIKSEDEREQKSDDDELSCGLADVEQNDEQSESCSDTIHCMEIEVKEYKEREEETIKKEEEEINIQESHSERPEAIFEMETGTSQEPKDMDMIDETKEPDSEPIKVVEKENQKEIEEEVTNEERERERERERNRLAVERAIREARERSFNEARERVERAAVERATAEYRQRAMKDVQEKAASAAMKASDITSSRIKAERAAVERATAEARQRALQKAMSSQNKVSEPRTEANGVRQTSSDLHISNGTSAESAQRSKAKLEKHNRIMERAAKALEEKEKRDLLAQKEQAERNRLSEHLDADIKRWSTGKEGNLRALLSTLQYILVPESGWQSVSLTEIITTDAVKKAYRKATLCVHPDKLQQRGASIQQKYICEKVFDLLKAAWNKFNSEER